MILILTTKRSGSTFISKKINSEAGYYYLGEFIDKRMRPSVVLEKLEFIRENPKTTLKVFPSRMNPMIESGIFKLAERVVIHARKDFNSQCRSLYVSSQTGIWHANKTPVKKVSYNQDEFEKIKNQLIEDYTLLNTYRKMIDNYSISYLEDVYSTENKYQQPVEWDVEPPTVYFNIEELFKS